MTNSSTDLNDESMRQAATDELIRHVNEQIDLLPFDDSDQDTLRQLVESFLRQTGYDAFADCGNLGADW